MVTPRTSAGTFPTASATAPSSGRRSSSTTAGRTASPPSANPAAADDGESGNEDLIDGGELENDYDGVGDGESFL